MTKSGRNRVKPMKSQYSISTNYRTAVHSELAERSVSRRVSIAPGYDGALESWKKLKWPQLKDIKKRKIGILPTRG